MNRLNSKLSLATKKRILADAFDYHQLSVIPRLSTISPHDVALTTRLTKNISCTFPFIASPMDSVIGEALALKIIEQNGVPIFHPFLGEKLYPLIETIRSRFPAEPLHIGLLISPDLTDLDAISSLLGNVISFVALDTLHQSPHLHLSAVAELKSRFPTLEIISGNVVFGEDCHILAEAGVDAFRVGMTSASINQGRTLVGCGRRQAVAVWDCAQVARELNLPLIADGGLKSISEAVIAFALGADTVMMGQMFAKIAESAAPTTINKTGQQLKLYCGMSQKGKISHELIAEGSTKELVVAGPFDKVVAEWLTILRLAISRAGFASLSDFRQNALLELSN